MVRDCGTKRAMETRRPAARRRPLDPRLLDELALRYVGRFATTRLKLRHYLLRKVKERGWDGAQAPDYDGLVERLSALGYVDDRGFAVAKAAQHHARGLGQRRLSQTLNAAGIDPEDRTEAIDRSTSAALEIALRFARRRRLGPFAAHKASDPKERQKAIAAFIRAGHGFDLARRLVALDPEPDCDVYELCHRLEHTLE